MKVFSSVKMKNITIFTKNIRNLLPYFLLIFIYFFFVNLEAKKDNKKNIIQEKDNTLIDDNYKIERNDMRIKIPVIPYNE